MEEPVVSKTKDWGCVRSEVQPSKLEVFFWHSQGCALLHQLGSCLHITAYAHYCTRLCLSKHLLMVRCLFLLAKVHRARVTESFRHLTSIDSPQKEVHCHYIANICFDHKDNHCVYMDTIFHFLPLYQKRQYYDSAVYMTNEDEHSTIIPVYMQLCILQLTSWSPPSWRGPCCGIHTYPETCWYPSLS